MQKMTQIWFTLL